MYNVPFFGGGGGGFQLIINWLGVVSHSYSHSAVHYQPNCHLKHSIGHFNKGIDVCARGKHRKFYRPPLAAGSLGERLNEGTGLGSSLTISCILLAIPKQDVVRRAWWPLTFESGWFFFKDGLCLPTWSKTVLKRLKIMYNVAQIILEWPIKKVKQRTTCTYWVMFLMAFSILCISAAYLSWLRDHHGMALRPGSLTNDLCQMDGNSSRDTASPYRAIAYMYKTCTLYISLGPSLLKYLRKKCHYQKGDANWSFGIMLYKNVYTFVFYLIRAIQSC